MSNTFECSRNDVIANAGMLIAVAGVAAFASLRPDIIVATLVAVLFLRSAFKVLTKGWQAYRGRMSGEREVFIGALNVDGN